MLSLFVKLASELLNIVIVEKNKYNNKRGKYFARKRQEKVGTKTYVET